MGRKKVFEILTVTNAASSSWASSHIRGALSRIYLFQNLHSASFKMWFT